MAQQTCEERLAVAIDTLIFALSSRDGRLRHAVRSSLVAIGEPAVLPLGQAIRHNSKNVRWESAKALGEIRDGRAAPPLIEALGDDDFDVRWVAAEGLITLGQRGLKPLLQTLIDGTDSASLFEGAHHVLDALADDERLRSLIVPVLEAMDGPSPDVDTIMQARAAIESLDIGPQARAASRGGRT